MDLERKALAWDVKALDDSLGSFAVYASVFGNVDRQGEIIAPGAFTNLPAFVKDGWGAINHDWDDLPVALIDEATQDGTGLLVKGRFHSTSDAQDCRKVVKERMEAGKSVKASIGYRVLEDAVETRDGQSVRILKRVEIFEFSFVNMPANPAAEVVRAKGLISVDDAKALIDHLEAGLKEGRVLSRANLNTIRNWAKTCREHSKLADAMDALCDQCEASLNPTMPGADGMDKPKAVNAAGALYGSFLANAARFPEYLLKGDNA